jgi:GrpB-like predicted nucleotidyltransferase (UPF0157 family)
MHDPEHARQALGHVSLVPSDPSWPEHFSQERDLLRPVLGRIAGALQHFGSTAIPGLSAKPIIDMMAPVASLDEADALGDQLANLGYIKIDAGFFKRRFFRKKTEGSEFVYHLHLAVSSTWPLKNELLLRDWLIQHPEIAHAYEVLKLQLAAEHGNDMPRYTDGKTSFLRRVVNEARLSRGLPPECDWDE